MTRLRTSFPKRLPKPLPTRTRIAPVAAAALASLLLAGCSGLGGNSSLTCKLPDGARCDSVSSTYAESTRGELPGQRKRQATTEPAPSGTSSPSPRGSDGGMLMQTDPRMVPVGMPVRSQPRIVRVWIKAWEDSDGDLHDQAFVYLPVTEGRWMVEHKQREARNAYAPVRTSAMRSTAPAAPAAPADIRPASLPPAPGSTATPAAPPAAAKPAERMSEAVQRARSQQPANGLRTEGGRSGS
jgi:conjugal transfer pilus assembly protein TraV